MSDKNLESSKKEPKDQSTSSQFQITPNAMLSSGKLSPPMRVSVSLKPNTPTTTLGKELWHQENAYNNEGRIDLWYPKHIIYRTYTSWMLCEKVIHVMHISFAKVLVFWKRVDYEVCSICILSLHRNFRKFLFSVDWTSADFSRENSRTPAKASGTALNPVEQIGS